MRMNILRPGILVSLKTSLRGNVSYEKEMFEGFRDGETLTSRWETTKRINNVDEHERAIKARGKACSLIRAACSVCEHGLICRKDRRETLEASIKEAREIVNTFNAQAELTHIRVSVVCGEIADDDVEAIRAINTEIKDLMADMAKGVKELNVKVIRDACNKAKSVGKILRPSARAEVEQAIALARKSARRIVQAGNRAAIEVDKQSIQAIKTTRMAFLDMDEAQAVETPIPEARAVDFAPENGDPIIERSGLARRSNRVSLDIE